MFDFFEIKDGAVKLDNAKIKNFSEFRILLSLKYNKSEEDLEGRKHLKARKMFTFIFLAYDIRSPYISLAEEDRFQKAAKAVFKVDKLKLLTDEKTAINKFIELQKEMYPEIRLLQNLKESMEIANNLTTLTNKKMNKFLMQIDALDDIHIEDGEVDNTNAALQSMQLLLDNIKVEVKYAMELVKHIKESTNTLTQLEKSLIEKHHATEAKGRGNSVIGNRADPK
jgi:hypothetical protein